LGYEATSLLCFLPPAAGPLLVGAVDPWTREGIIILFNYNKTEGIMILFNYNKTREGMNGVCAGPFS